jgi:hypothetical protein
MSENGMAKHHPVFFDFRWSAPRRVGDMSINSIGAKQRIWYDAAVTPNATPFAMANDKALESPPLVSSVGSDDTTQYMPALGEEYFEWIDVLESVQAYCENASNGRPYVFVELGAGYGRWSVNAIQALRQKGKESFRICAVEADEQHIEWLRQNFRDNRINPDEQIVVQSPLTGDGRTVNFLTGDYGSWYGQAVIDDAFADKLRASPRARRSAGVMIGRPTWLTRALNPKAKKSLVTIPSQTFEQILALCDGPIDIADIDIQGMEGELIEGSITIITRRIKRLHIGTHSDDIEERLRRVLAGAGWKLVRDFACLGLRDTPYGPVAFGDGIQSWVNPHLTE